ncbi:CDP-glucose 4,6-dehydratase [Paenibacillus sp. PsM32]|uniref:CDP-glucose 4,6-dehydratase n=1 Tax=Paenibacillus sp. PsM32 TaxID=3030536 RepID=UPI00263AFDA6|nr:CDP-glucose 4,6-dehydratase [Paenibacillus sp. PsM32]MDN4620960.1 CDP-glucose 4,6-dehydratase [Paenibacillus sp. PsM32]
MDTDFWKNKKVFITGNTGFKGSWLTLWLLKMGSQVSGYSLAPPTTPSLYDISNLDKEIFTSINNIQSFPHLSQALEESNPDIIIHMAAQPLVRESYTNPLETYSTNFIGTLNLLESIRILNQKKSKKRVVINVTTDKCYDNKEWHWSYRENDTLGGYDPYSNSKACSELLTSSYRTSFFNVDSFEKHGVLLASARAGNVIGGGDWAKDRLIPDCIKNLLNNESILIRNPSSIRPWQHVLEPLNGYLLLAQTMYEKGTNFAEAWNFGPNDEDAQPVEWIVKKVCNLWGQNASYKIINSDNPVHEAHYLKLDCSKAKNELKWYPRWNIETALEKVVDWNKEYLDNRDIQNYCLKQIESYSL